LYGEHDLHLAKKTAEQRVFIDAAEYIYKNKGFTPEDLKKAPVRKLIENINSVLTQAISEGLLDNSIKHEVGEDIKESLMNNVWLFSGMKTYYQCIEASAMLVSADGKIKPFNEFKNDVIAIHEKYNERYLQSEYLFATHSSLMAAKWNDFEQDGDRYNLQYRTAGDELVRESHQILHNTTLPINDTFWDSYMPPLGWRCRCTVVQVRKSKYKISNSSEAAIKGEQATTQLDANGVNKAAMFRFNPGKEKIVFPNKHPYMPRESSPQDVKQAAKIIEETNEKWETIETSNGTVRVSSLHGKNEKDENILIAKYFAEKYNQHIDLIANKHSQPSADAYNKSRKIEQEYKVSVGTFNSIDKRLHAASKQSPYVVVKIKEDFNKKIVKEAICSRVLRSNIKEVIVLYKNNDITLTRDMIIKRDFEL
jgi:SPP1 gp7 family putative phage head morphogenesis protein